MAKYSSPMMAYVVTNTISGKRYIGITRRTIAIRWRQHIADAVSARRTTGLGRAIKKYGEEVFLVDVLCCATSWDNLCAAEILLIKQWNTLSPHGYNLTSGGEGIVGYKYPREIVEHIASLLRGRTVPRERVLRSIESRRRNNTPMSTSARLAISKHRKGKILSPEHCAKLSVAKLGKTLPPRTSEHSAKISEGLRLAWARKKGVA